MFKTMTLFLRGAADGVGRSAPHSAEAAAELRRGAEAAEADCAAAKRAVAVAAAYGEMDRRALERVTRRIADMESRARAALSAGGEALAEEIAGALAEQEAVRAALAASVAAHDAEIARHRTERDLAETRRRALQEALALAGEAGAGRRLTGAMPEGVAALVETAEAARAALEARRAEAQSPGKGACGRAAAAGFVSPPAPDAAEVLARLRAERS